MTADHVFNCLNHGFTISNLFLVYINSPIKITLEWFLISFLEMRKNTFCWRGKWCSECRDMHGKFGQAGIMYLYFKPDPNIISLLIKQRVSCTSYNYPDKPLYSWITDTIWHCVTFWDHRTWMNKLKSQYW